MDEVGPSGLERVFFGAAGTREIDRGLGAVVAELLGTGVVEVMFRSGRIDAVYGLRLADGRVVVLKVHRPPVELISLTATVKVLRHLAEAGYPCPQPLTGPVSRDGRVFTVQSFLDDGSEADGREPGVRRAMAQSLARQIDLLRAVPLALTGELGPGPAWTRYHDGPWPTPHDPIFDFTRTPAGWRWLDSYAAAAADEVLRRREPHERVVGHGDWYAGNLRFEGDRVVAVFDWDLVVEPEAVIVGLSAGGRLLDGAPTADDVGSFLSDYEDARGGALPGGWALAVAAAQWVLAFNARCDLAMSGGQPAPSSALARLADGRAAYAALA